MPFAILMDHQVPRQLTRALRGRGLDVLTAFEDGSSELPDEQLLQRATQLGRILFTRDADFLVLATALQRGGSPFFGVVYAHQDVPIGVCVNNLEIIAVAGQTEDIDGRVIYIPL